MTDAERQKAMRDFFWNLVHQKEKTFGCVHILVNDLFDDDEEYKHMIKTKNMKELGSKVHERVELSPFAERLKDMKVAAESCKLSSKGQYGH